MENTNDEFMDDANRKFSQMYQTKTRPVLLSNFTGIKFGNN